MIVEPPRPSVSRSAPPRRRFGVGTAVRVAAMGVVIVVLPFVLLVRSAVYFYAHHGFGAWIAVGLALAVTALVLTAYAAWASLRLTGRVHLRAAFLWVAAPLVVGYGGYFLLHLSQVNAKTPAVRAYYRSLHPVLRAAVGTLVLVDRDLVVTDVRRTPADYAAMGLPAAEASLHYEQAGGYVHALDLRTLGRAAWRNWLTDLYFRAMGFRTLRHVGTADHLHVSLPSAG